MTDHGEEIYYKYRVDVLKHKQNTQKLKDELQWAKAVLIDIEQELKDGNITQEEYEGRQDAMQMIIDEVTEAISMEYELLRHCEEFISAYEEKQQRESDQSFKN
tara:strand:+ start:954 stop:1265 length:312 start_codon:yes stop_codon:yes gene_type:complete